MDAKSIAYQEGYKAGLVAAKDYVLPSSDMVISLAKSIDNTMQEDDKALEELLSSDNRSLMATLWGSDEYNGTDLKENFTNFNIAQDKYHSTGHALITTLYEIGMNMSKKST